MKRFLKKYYWLIIILVGYFVLTSINYDKGYFQTDIEAFRSSIKGFNKYLALLFVLIFTGIILIRKPRKWRQKIAKIKENILEILFYLIFIGLSILLTIDDFNTDAALVINKQGIKGEIKRTLPIGYYDYKKQNLVILDYGFEDFKMTTEAYKSLDDTNQIDMTFKLGLLSIPYDPEVKD